MLDSDKTPTIHAIINRISRNASNKQRIGTVKKAKAKTSLTMHESTTSIMLILYNPPTVHSQDDHYYYLNIFLCRVVIFCKIYLFMILSQNM